MFMFFDVKFIRPDQKTRRNNEALQSHSTVSVQTLFNSMKVFVFDITLLNVLIRI